MADGKVYGVNINSLVVHSVRRSGALLLGQS